LAATRPLIISVFASMDLATGTRAVAIALETALREAP
jgi:hypothetical protein